MTDSEEIGSEELGISESAGCSKELGVSKSAGGSKELEASEAAEDTEEPEASELEGAVAVFSEVVLPVDD